MQPRAEKRANKFAGCQVNVEREIREFTINVGAQEIFGRKGAVLGGSDCPGRVALQRRAGDPPEGGNGIKWLGGAGPYHCVSRMRARMGDGS